MGWNGSNSSGVFMFSSRSNISSFMVLANFELKLIQNGVEMLHERQKHESAVVNFGTAHLS